MVVAGCPNIDCIADQFRSAFTWIMIVGIINVFLLLTVVVMLRVHIHEHDR